MVSLVTLISSGKGTWGQVNTLLRQGQWDHAYVICNDFAYSQFQLNDSSTTTKLRFEEKEWKKSYQKLVSFFRNQLKGEMEVAVNISSGGGMEHMAVISALLKAGVGVYFVYADDGGVKEFSILDKSLQPLGDADDEQLL